MNNKEIAQSFSLLAKMLELHGENAFKVRSYNNAAFTIKRMSQALSDMEPAQIASIKGVGPAIQKKIADLLSTGTMPTLDRYLAKTPAGVVEMLGIPGLGAKKIGLIWNELGVASPGELLYACYENRLAMLKGFGLKTQQKVIDGIQFLQANQGNMHFAKVEALAFALRDLLSPHLDRMEFSGAFRRCVPVLDKLQLIAQGDSEKIRQLLKEADFEIQANSDKQLIRALSQNSFPLEISFAAENQFESLWLRQSSASAHVDRLEADYNLNWDLHSEEAIYNSADLPWIAPELREDKFEFNWIKNGGLPTLINPEDIRGVVHAHSTWSDGGASIEEMARACKAKGYDYLVLSDHSRSAVYAGGLDIEQVKDQHKEIDELNRNLDGFRIFKSIESDILGDGSLDYPDEILGEFDFVIGSIHSALSMDEERATSRLNQAVSHPLCDMLGHPSGRMLLARSGYPVNYPSLIDTCAKHNTAIEINANPFRLDIDWTWIPTCVENSVPISINPDAHSIDGIDDIRYGVLTARKGGLEKSQCWNCQRMEEIQELAEKRKVRASQIGA
jgi:DNA polymerase (family 10)